MQAASPSHLSVLNCPSRHSGSDSLPCSPFADTDFAGEGTATRPADTAKRWSAALPFPAAASVAGAAYYSMTSASATLSPAATLLPQTRCSFSGASNSVITNPSPSLFCAVAARRSSEWCPRTSYPPQPSSVTVPASAKSSRARRSALRVPRVRCPLLNCNAAASDPCSLTASVPTVLTRDADPASSSSFRSSWPFPAGFRVLPGAPAPCRSPPLCGLPSVTGSSAPSPAARAAGSFSNDIHASSLPRVAATRSPTAAASTVSTTANGASLPSRTPAAQPPAAGAARENPASCVLYSSRGSASFSQSSFPSRLQPPRISRGTPLLPFIRSRPSRTLPHMQLPGHVKYNSSFSGRSMHEAARRVLTTAATASTRQGLLLREQPAEESDRDNSNTEKNAHVELEVPEQRPGKTTRLVFQQTRQTTSEKLTPPQQQNAQRHAQTTLHHRYDPQLQRRPPVMQGNQCLFSFEIHYPREVDTASGKVVEMPQQEQCALTQKFTRAAYPHARLHQGNTYKAETECKQPERPGSPGQAKQQQTKTQPQQRHPARQAQKHLTPRRQQHFPQQDLKSLSQERGQLLSLQQQKLSEQHQQHGVTRGQQADAARQHHKTEMSEDSVAVAGAYKLLASSNNSMRKQLVCYVCLSVARAAAGGKIPVAVSCRDGLLSPLTSSSAVIAGYTEGITPRSAVTVTNRAQAPAVSKSEGHSSKGFASVAVAASGGRSDPWNRSDTEHNLSSSSGYVPRMRISSGSIVVGDLSSATSCTRNNVAVSGSDRCGGERSNTTRCCFYDVGGLLLCQQCALLPGVHTARQVNALLEEALCVLAEEADVNFNHPDLLELHRLALGSSSGCRQSTCTSPNDTTDSRSGSGSDTIHSSDRNGRHSKSISATAETRSSSSSERISRTASTSVTSSSSDDDTINRLSSPEWNWPPISSDTNSTTHRRERSRIKAASQGPRSRAGCATERQTNSADEGDSKMDNRETEDARLSSTNNAWEFPFYVEAVNLSALLQPSCLEVPLAADLQPAADGFMAGRKSRVVGAGWQSPAAAATHRAAAGGLATVEAPGAITKTPLPTSDSLAGPAAHARCTAPPKAATLSPASACRSDRKTKSSGTQQSLVPELGIHSMECSSYAASRYLHPFDQPAVVLQQQVPERIVFGRCETLKVYLSQASVGVATAHATSAGALRRKRCSSRAAVRCTTAAGESINTETPAARATNAPQQGALRGGEAGQSARPVMEATVARAASADVSARAPEAFVVSKRHEVAGGLKKNISGMTAVEATKAPEAVEQDAAAARGVPTAKAPRPPASEEMADKSPAAASVEPREAVEVPATGAYATTATTTNVEGLTPSAEKRGRTKICVQQTCKMNVLNPACRRASSEEQLRAVPSETERKECKEEHPNQLEGNTGKTATGGAEKLQGGLERIAETASEVKQHSQRRRHVKNGVFRKGARPEQADTNDTSSHPAPLAAGEAVGRIRVLRQPREEAVKREEAVQMELTRGHGSKKGTTYTGRFPYRAAEHSPASSACPTLSELALKKNARLLCDKECKFLLQQKKEEYTRFCRGKQAAAAGSTEAPPLRRRADDAAPAIIEASFQPAVHRIAVARGLPEAVFLAHLGHELLHAYIWCTTDVTASSAAVPAESEKEEADNLFARNADGVTPHLLKESSGVPRTRSTGSACVSSRQMCGAPDDAKPKTVRGIRIKTQQHTTECGTGIASVPPDKCVAGCVRRAAHFYGDVGASRFHVETGKERRTASTPRERRVPSALKRRSLSAAESALASYSISTNDGEGIQGNRERNGSQPGIVTQPQQESSSAIRPHSAPANSGRVVETRNGKPVTQHQHGQKSFAAVDAPLQRFPPLDLPLEEGLCNCVAAALLERRASALCLRLQKLLAAAGVAKRKRQATTAEAGSPYTKRSTSGTAPFETQFPTNYEVHGSKGLQAVKQNKDKPCLLASSVQRHDVSPPYTVQHREGHRVVAGGIDHAEMEKRVRAYSRDERGQHLLAEEHRRAPQEHTLAAAHQQQQHCKHQMTTTQKQQQRLHQKYDRSLQRQQQQQTQSCQQRTLDEPLQRPEGNTWQRRERYRLLPQSRVNQYEEVCEFTANRYCHWQHQMQDKCSESPPQREPELQDMHTGGLILHEEQLQENLLYEQMLQQQISMSAHELQVIQMRLRLMETDSHAVYGHSYKTLRSLVKRVGLQVLFETARRGHLQQLVSSFAPTLDT